MTPLPALAALAILAVTFPAAAVEPVVHPTIAIVDAATIESQCDAKLAEFRRRMKAMEAVRSSKGIFDEWNRLSIVIEDFSGPIGAAVNLSTDKATRDASDACTTKLAPFQTELFQSEALYARVRDAKPVDAIQASYRTLLIESFEDAGVTLPKDSRDRVKAINERLTTLGLEYDRNVRDDATTVVMRPDDMAGLPDAYLAQQKRDADGAYLLPLTYPAYFPFLTLASNADARRRYWIAMTNKGGAGNLPLLDEAVRLRRELAGLYGQPDYATYLMRHRMVGDPQTAYRFLDGVRGAVTELEKKDIEELRLFKAQDTKQPDARLERWDLRYYEEKLRKARYDVDQEALRRYFPTEASVAYVLKVAETLYGIRFEARQVPTWHPSTRFYDVYEAKGDRDGNAKGDYIGGVYLDLFPREGKYGHAHAEGARSESLLAHRTPISILVVNLNEKGLNEDELVTLMHEFGHVLHGVLSKARYVDQAGANVRLDFVEAPSQMFEEWALREEPLSMFAQICRDCPHLTHAQYLQMDASRKFGRGVAYGRQLLLASYDLALTTPDPGGSLATWEKLEGATPLGYVSGTMFPANFTHLMDGYAAGYYGYMWSKVLALDMLSGFHGHLMNPADGARYRRDILSRGAEVPPERLVEDFLGRKPNSDAFFQDIAGKR
jgi:thimet oligopeptidase